MVDEQGRRLARIVLVATVLILPGAAVKFLGRSSPSPASAHARPGMAVPAEGPSADIARAGSAPCARPYGRRSPWNRPIPRRARYDARSDYHVRGAFSSAQLSSDPTQYTYPVYRVTKRTPRRQVRLRGYFSHVRARGRRLSNQSGGTVRMPVPVGLDPAAGTDAQVIIVDPDTGEEWGAWQLERNGAGWSIQNGYRYNTRWS